VRLRDLSLGLGLELFKATEAHRAARARTGEILRRRNLLIHEALAVGWTYQQIASESGLLESDVRRIAAELTADPD
jgi:hypothetical protein